MNRQQRRAAAATAPTPGEVVKARVRANSRLNIVAHVSAAIGEAYEQDAAVQRTAVGLSPGHLSCKAGCAACCDQLIMVHDIEVRELITYYPEVVGNALGEFAKQETELLDLAAEMHIPMEVLDILNPNAAGCADARQALHNAWFARRRPCPFLDRQTRRCRVYAHRPLVCREHVVKHAPEICDDRSGEITQEVWTSTAFLQTGLAQCTASKKLETPARLGLLGTMVMTVVCEENLL